jgi:hypothetical protein
MISTDESRSALNFSGSKDLDAPIRDSLDLRRAGDDWRVRSWLIRRLDSVEPPLAWNSFQHAAAPVGESNISAGQKIPDGARNHHLGSSGATGDPRSDMHRDSGHITSEQFADRAQEIAARRRAGRRQVWRKLAR